MTWLFFVSNPSNRKILNLRKFAEFVYAQFIANANVVKNYLSIEIRGDK